MSNASAAASDHRPDYTRQPNNSKLKHIPGKNGWPIIGVLPELRNDVFKLAETRWKEFGPISRVHFGPQPGVLALGPDMAQTLLLDGDRNFSTRMGYDYALRPFYGDNLLCLDFDEHKFQRRIMQTSFKTPSMRSYVEIMNPILERGMDAWVFDDSFRFYESVKNLLLRMTCKVFYGVEEHDEGSDELAQAFVDILDAQEGIIRLDLPGLKYHTGKNGQRFLRDYITKLIPIRRAGDGQDMLSHMCKETKPDGSYFSDEEIVDHASFLLFAAHDTTTSTLNHLMYYLAKHQDWQQRLRDEGAAQHKDYLDYEDLGNVVELDAAFNEAQRLNPSVTVLVRRSIRECELAGHRIPANTMIFQLPMFTNRMSDYWTNPHSFDPERFFPERAEQKGHPFCFMPFGGGAHKCIGMHFAAMQSKLFMHQFLRKYEFRLPDDYKVAFTYIPMPKIKDGLPLVVEKRRA
ncbi:cytochrome P450 [Spongiibacter tropicus]|uniref:cytochrome P450 n=1 Tax=Spongiibacter tropicus TaxID=454602 RepID=UPI0003B78005|nr:cytochrome P450 [Spongiibacter tropicus]